VHGVDRLHPAHVIAASGLVYGAHVLEVNLDRVARNVADLTWVRRATVQRRLPGEILITIVERTPVAKLVADGIEYLVDAEGMVLHTASGENLPAVRGVKEPVVGRLVAVPAYFRVVAMLEMMGQASLSGLGEVVIGPDGDLSLLMKDGVAVYLGIPGIDLGDKLSWLESILEDIENTSLPVKEVDLRYSGRPLVRLRDSMESN